MESFTCLYGDESSSSQPTPDDHIDPTQSIPTMRVATINNAIHCDGNSMNLLYSDTDSDSQLIPTQLDAGSQSQSIQQPLSVLNSGSELSSLTPSKQDSLHSNQLFTSNIVQSDVQSCESGLKNCVSDISVIQSTTEQIDLMDTTASNSPVRLETMNCDVDIPFDSNVNAVRDVLSTATQVYACNDMIKQDSVQETEHESEGTLTPTKPISTVIEHADISAQLLFASEQENIVMEQESACIDSGNRTVIPRKQDEFVEVDDKLNNQLSVSTLASLPLTHFDTKQVCDVEIQASQAISELPADLANGMDNGVDHSQKTTSAYIGTTGKNTTDHDIRYWGASFGTVSATEMPAFDDHDSIMESQDFQFQPDSNPQISQNNSNTPLLAHQDTVSTTLDTILESTAQVSAVYHQMKTSWLNDQSLMKQKMIESEYQLQESQSLVSSLKSQLASISEESRNTFVRNRELLQQSSQMNSDKIIATVSPLLSECSLIKQSIVGIKDELATSTKTLFDDTRQVLIQYQAETAAFQASIKESYSTEIATLADNLQKQNSLLENAYGELASTCTERDTAIERFKGIQCSLTVIHDRFAKRESNFLKSLESHKHEYQQLEQNIAELTLECQLGKTHREELEAQISKMTEMATVAEQRALAADERDLQYSSAQSILQTSLDLAEQNLQVVKSTLKERDDELAQAYLDLKEFSECTRNASELWEVKQADYVACINKLRLEIKTSEESMEEMQTKFDQVSKQFETTMSDLNKSMDDFQKVSMDLEQSQVALFTAENHIDALKQRELEMEQELCSKSAALDAAKSEIQVNVEMAEKTSMENLAVISKLEYDLLESATSKETLYKELVDTREILQGTKSILSDLQQTRADIQSDFEMLTATHAEFIHEYQKLGMRMSEKDAAFLKLEFELKQNAVCRDALDNDVLSLQRDLEEEQVKAAKEAQKYDALSIELSETCETVKKLQDHIVELQQAESDFRMNLDQQTLAHQHMVKQLESDHASALQSAQEIIAEYSQSIAMLNNNLVDLQNERSNLASQLQQEKHDTEQKSIAHTSMVNDIQEELVKQLSDNTIIFAKYDLLLDSFSEKCASFNLMESMMNERNLQVASLEGINRDLEEQLKVQHINIGQLEKATTDLDAYMNQKVDFELKLESIQKSLVAAESEIYLKDASLDAAGKDISKWQARFDTIDAQMAIMQKSLNEKTDDNALLSTKLANVLSETDLANAQTSELAKRLEIVETQYAQSDLELNAARDALEKANQKHAEDTAEKTRIHTEAQTKIQSDFKNQMMQLMAQNKEAVIANIELRKQVDYLYNKIGKLQTSELHRTISKNSIVIQATQGSIVSESILPMGGVSEIAGTVFPQSESSSSQATISKVKRRVVEGHRGDITPTMKRVRGDVLSQGSSLGGSVLNDWTRKGAINCTPGSVRRAREANVSMLISISGFKEVPPFNSALRDRIAKSTKTLPDACFLSSSTVIYDPRITHVISPKGTRTLKIFAASLMGAWLIYDPAWITDSVSNGAWLPEDKYGHRSQTNPYLGKQFFLAPSFKNDPKFKDNRQEQITCLVTMCSKGSFVDRAEDADIVMRTDEDTDEYPVKSLTWTTFISLIPYSQK
ncbi:hypothetical protein RTP6_005867 [Batrachochytrium dendrobatidis]